MLREINRCFASVGLLLLIASPALGGDVYSKNYVAKIGGTGEVEVAITDASDVANVALKVNYDANILELLTVTNKPVSLGTNFNLCNYGGDGTTEIVLTRKDVLVAGSGVLATMVFRVNPGARPGTYCFDVVILAPVFHSLLHQAFAEWICCSGWKK